MGRRRGGRCCERRAAQPLRQSAADDEGETEGALDGQSKRVAKRYLQLGSESPTSLVVVLHGIYMNARWMKPFAKEIANALPHARLLIPERPERGGDLCGKWFLEPSGPPNPVGIEEPRAQIVEEIRELQKLYKIPLSRVVLVGFSMGTSMAGYVAKAFLPEACGGLVLLSGGTPYKNHAKSQVFRQNTHVLLSVMSDEPGNLVKNLPKLADDMASRGLQVAFHKFEGSHLDAIKSKANVGVVKDFLLERLPPTASSPTGV